MKADRELEQITNELRSFDGLANHRINGEMKAIIEEETSKQKERIKNLDD